MTILFNSLSDMIILLFLFIFKFLRQVSCVVQASLELANCVAELTFRVPHRASRAQRWVLDGGAVAA